MANPARAETSSQENKDLSFTRDKMQLYIADDNPQFCDLLVRVASSRGWKTTTCQNGRELVAAVRSGTCPSLLLIDVQMPEMDGVESIAELCSVDRPLRLRFMTGGPESSALAAQLIAKARNFDVGDPLIKPVKIDHLQSVLDEEAARIKQLA